MTTIVDQLEVVKSDADQRAMGRGCYFDHAAAAHVCDFFEKFLVHSKGRWAGQPFKLMDWQRHDVLMPLFGWKRADGTRRYRMAYIEVPKKNGKSTLGAGIGLYMLVADGEDGAEVYCAAADRDQASIVFREAANMVEASAHLNRRLQVLRSVKTINKDGASWYKALSADVPTKEGLNIHFLNFDELHAQRTREMWETLRYGGASRQQPMTITITTAGYDRHSICYEQHDYACKVRDGIIEDDSFFPYIRAASEDDDWTDPETWRKANPSMGVTIDEEEMAASCKEAQEIATKENAFKRYRLNIWTEQDVRWLPMDKWDACGGVVDGLDGRQCFAGLDLASTTDIAAFVLLFPDDPGYLVLPFFWTPRDTAHQRERKDRVPYVTWGREGLIKLTEGNVIDYDVLRQDINELGKRYEIREIAIDRWNSTQLQTQLMGDGFEVVQFGQGYASMTAPTKELERLVLEAKLAHGGNPVLRWMASNVTVETDAAGNLKPSKKKSIEKIDGIVATIMALGRAMVSEGDGKSVYDQRGILTV